MKREDRKCKNCEVVMKAPRPNKVFCDTLCKSEYHNKIYKEDGRYAKEIQNTGY